MESTKARTKSALAGGVQDEKNGMMLLKVPDAKILDQLVTP